MLSACEATDATPQEDAGGSLGGVERPPEPSDCSFFAAVETRALMSAGLIAPVSAAITAAATNAYRVSMVVLERPDTPAMAEKCTDASLLTPKVSSVDSLRLSKSPE